MSSHDRSGSGSGPPRKPTPGGGGGDKGKKPDRSGRLRPSPLSNSQTTQDVDDQRRQTGVPTSPGREAMLAYMRFYPQRQRAGTLTHASPPIEQLSERYGGTPAPPGRIADHGTRDHRTVTGIAQGARGPVPVSRDSAAAWSRATGPRPSRNTSAPAASATMEAPDYYPYYDTDEPQAGPSTPQQSYPPPPPPDLGSAEANAAARASAPAGSSATGGTDPEFDIYPYEEVASDSDPEAQ